MNLFFSSNGRMMLQRLKWALVLPACFIIIAHAQQPGDIELIQQQSDQFYHQQQQQIEAEQRKRQEQQKRSIINLPQAAPVPPTRHSSTRCFTINQIDIEGVHPAFQEKIQKLTESWLHKCLGLTDINTILKSISGFYLKNGYITSRAYLPQQNLSRKTLLIKVIEGKLEAFDRRKAPHINTDTAFPDMQGNILNLRDIEQGLERLNRLQSNHVTMDLAPGKSIGETIIRLNNNYQRPWQAHYRFDNSGQESTGEHQHKLYISRDNLFGLNDFVSSSVGSDDQKDSDGKKSQSLSLHFDAPRGYWLFALDANWSEYINRVHGQTTQFDSSGKNNQQTFSLSKIISRDQVSKTELSGALTRKSAKNYIEDVLLDSSSRTLSIAKLKLRYQHFFAHDRTWVFSLGYQQGLPLFGSPDRKGSDAPNPKYHAFLLETDFNTPFHLASTRYHYSLQISAQYSDDILFGSEKFSIGSLYTVRGFKQQSLAGRSGVFWRNEFSRNLFLNATIPGIKIVTPFLGLDTGAIHGEPENPKGKILSGIALGLRASGNKLNLEVTLSKPIQQPDDFTASGKQVDFSITYNF